MRIIGYAHYPELNIHTNHPLGFMLMVEPDIVPKDHNNTEYLYLDEANHRCVLYPVRNGFFVGSVRQPLEDVVPHSLTSFSSTEDRSIRLVVFLKDAFTRYLLWKRFFQHVDEYAQWPIYRYDLITKQVTLYQG